MQPVSRRYTFVIHEEPPVVVIEDGGQTHELSPLWLRERTQAPDQLEAMTQQRLFDSHAIDADLTLTRAARVGGQQVDLTFSDGHREIYDLSTLVNELGETEIFPAAEPWDASLEPQQMRFDWNRVLNDPAYFQASLDAYLRRGYIVLHGVPTDPERILQVGSHFGYVKETNFGRYFEVYSRPSGNDLAYRSVALGPHTDNPYRDPVPGSSCYTAWSTRPLAASPHWPTASRSSSSCARKRRKATNCSSGRRCAFASSTPAPSWSPSAP